MLEYLVVLLTILTVLMYMAWPFIRHYNKYKHEKDLLVKRYNRLWRSRRDLLVSTYFSRLGWAGCYSNRFEFIPLGAHGLGYISPRISERYRKFRHWSWAHGQRNGQDSQWDSSSWKRPIWLQVLHPNAKHQDTALIHFIMELALNKLVLSSHFDWQ